MRASPARQSESDVSDPTAPMHGADLTIRGVSHGFGDVAVLDGIDLDLQAGETTAIVGPSGCGKSTLLELIAGLSEPAAGSIGVGSRGDAAGRLDQCAYMPQRDLLLPWLRAIDNAALPITLGGVGKRQARALAVPVLHRLGLAQFERSMPSELSGGMRQRVAFARTILAGKPMMLLDEPFGALDAITRADLQSWLAGALAGEPRSTVLVTHDVEEALLLGDRVHVMSARPARIVWTGSAPQRPGAISTSRSMRTEIVTDPDFVTKREEALEALRGSM